MRGFFGLGLALALIAGCLADPPDDGWLYLSITADNTGGSEDVSLLRFKADYIEVVHGSTRDGERTRFRIPGSEGALLYLQFDGGGQAVASASIPVPKGFVDQVRFVVPGGEVTLPAGRVESIKVPSGPQTGIKIHPPSGAGPFPIAAQKVTKVSVNFRVEEQLLRPGGRFQFKPTLEGQLMTGGAEEQVFTVGEVVVRFKDGANQSQIDAAIEGYDSRASIKLTLWAEIHLLVLQIPEDRSILEALDYFRAHPAASYAIPSIIGRPYDNPRPAGAPNDPQFGGQAYLPQVSAPAAWDRQIGTMAPIVAVLDTGVDTAHQDLAQNLFFNAAEIPPGVTIVDAEPDGIITFRDLNAAANAGVVTDSNGNGIIDCEDVLQPRAAGGLADGVDNDFIAGEPTDIVDDLCGARIGRFPARGGAQVLDNRLDDDQSPTATVNINGHGTHVAGILGAQGNNARQIAGVAWNVRVLPIKVCDNTPACDTVLTLTHALRYARRMGARVANYSLGVAQNDPKATAARVRELVLDPGDGLVRDGLRGTTETMVIVIAAGNTGLNCDTVAAVCFPSEVAFEQRINVGSVSSSDGRSTFSEFGPTLVDIAAPGEDTLSLDRSNGTQTSSGTSFAAPQVAGLGALLLAQNPAAVSTPAALRRAILAGSDSIGGLTGSFSGGRRLNLRRGIDGLGP